MSYYSSARQVTNKILAAIDEGILVRQHIIECCLRYMSEDDVKDMAEREMLFEWEEESLRKQDFYLPKSKGHDKNTLKQLLYPATYPVSKDTSSGRQILKNCVINCDGDEKQTTE